jgi:hypothetical protein
LVGPDFGKVAEVVTHPCRGYATHPPCASPPRAPPA